MTQNDEIVKILLQAITWIIMIWGWWLVNKQNNDRELRKEIRSLVTEMQVFLTDIENKAIEYHSLAEIDEKLSVELKNKLNKGIRNKINILKIYELDGVDDRFDKMQLKLRQSITFSNFDDKDFVKKLPSDKIFMEIAAEKETFSQELEKCFANSYTRKGFFFVNTGFFKKLKKLFLT